MSDQSVAWSWPPPCDPQGKNMWNFTFTFSCSVGLADSRVWGFFLTTEFMISSFLSFGESKLQQTYAKVLGFEVSFYWHTEVRLCQLTSWEARQEIPHSAWNPHVQHHVHNSPSYAPVQSQINPVHALPSYFFKTYFNIVLTSMHRSSKWPLSWRFL